MAYSKKEKKTHITSTSSSLALEDFYLFIFCFCFFFFLIFWMRRATCNQKVLSILIHFDNMAAGFLLLSLNSLIDIESSSLHFAFMCLHAKMLIYAHNVASIASCYIHRIDRRNCWYYDRKFLSFILACVWIYNGFTVILAYLNRWVYLEYVVAYAATASFQWTTYIMNW